MSKVIYNEGRTTGISSYEEYVRQLKSIDPSFAVCTEREWLAASLATGSSMILKISAGAGTNISGSDMYTYQVEFPSDTHIGAANTLLGYYFYGEGTVDSKGWVRCVTDYGSLISNTSSSSPADDSTSITTSNPPMGSVKKELEVPDSKDMSTITYTTQQLRILQYSKIADGIVIQPGTWSKSGKTSPYKDFEPELSAGNEPVLRLTFMEPITEDFYILITGFTNRSIIRGITKFDFGAVDTENPEDGDFLGPECFPWSCKVQFAASPYAEFLTRHSLRSGSRNVKIETYDDTPLIKITSNNLLNMLVYSRVANTTTGTSKEDDYGLTHKTWEGTKDASAWYSTTGTENIVSKCSDNDIDTSGQETIQTYTPVHADNKTTIGLSVEDNYKSDDMNVIKNGRHGGFYEIEIDPYKLIKDFIDEVFARFDYVDDRFDQMDEKITKLFNYLMKIIYGDVNKPVSGETSLVDILNELLQNIFTDGSTVISIDNSEKVEIDTTDIDSSTKPMRTVIKWKDGKNLASTFINGEKLAKGTLNMYSGDNEGSDNANYIVTRGSIYTNGSNQLRYRESENDIWSK